APVTDVTRAAVEVIRRGHVDRIALRTGGIDLRAAQEDERGGVVAGGRRILADHEGARIHGDRHAGVYEDQAVDVHAAARRQYLVLLDVAVDRGRIRPRRDPVGGDVTRPAGTRTGDVRARTGADREEGRVAGEEVEEDDDVTDSDAAVVVNVAALAG